MLDTPNDLTADQISSFVRNNWGLEVDEVTYAPLGHGSYNWIVETTGGTTWFAKADRSGPDNTTFFRATYRTAAALRQRGLDFVNAPVPDLSGELRPKLSPGWEIGLFPFIEGRNPKFHGPERALIAEVIGQLHACTDIPDMALHWGPGYRQPELRQLIAHDLDQPWNDGPYGERARTLVRDSLAGIDRLFAHHARLVERLLKSGDPWVITHGEPHGGNTMLDTAGRIHLVDCNAPMVAPRERDLRLLLYGGHRVPRGLDNTEVLAAYRRNAGAVEPRSYVLELFRADWHLSEISGYGQFLSRPHDESAGMRSVWHHLNNYLPIEPNWPELA